MQEFTDQVNHHRFTEQEDVSSHRMVDQQDSVLTATEGATLPSPAPQTQDQKEDDSKREPVDEE